MRELLKAGVNPNQRSGDNREYATPLHCAAASGDLETVRVLLAASADPNATDATHGGKRPIHCAATAGVLSIFEALAEAGADLSATYGGRTAIHDLALPFGDMDEKVRCLRYLVSKGVPWDSADQYGTTPLIVTGSSDDALPLTAALLQFGSNVNAANEDGTTPIYLAAAEGATQTIVLLLERGARTDIRRRDGKSPIEWARALGKDESARLLSARPQPAPIVASAAGGCMLAVLLPLLLILAGMLHLFI